MRREQVAPGEHYHVYNRGVGKQTIFHDRRDYERFLFLIMYFQAPITFNPLGRYVKQFVENPVFNIDAVLKKRYIELAGFCLLPNHFHLIIKETDDRGIARYMQKVLNSYTKYYNTKYEKSGHLFQGPYQAVHVEDDRQLLHLSAYIHKNPEGWRNYKWSSYGDYVNGNRWGKLIENEVILGQFKDRDQYKKFVESSLAKELKEELGPLGL